MVSNSDDKILSRASRTSVIFFVANQIDFRQFFQADRWVNSITLVLKPFTLAKI
ncbi:hypothetical protein CKA32_001810 [Geitlerinema sp. FC II]|nr:hypothetical protein CKA32_001810 [Geitlerinema sp. FC II]